MSGRVPPALQVIPAMWPAARLLPCRKVQVEVLGVPSGLTEPASTADSGARAAPHAVGVAMATTPTAPGRVRPDDGSGPARRGHIGRIVAGSLATGLIAALLLALAPFISP